MKRFRTYPDEALLIVRVILFISFLLHGLAKYNMGLSNVAGFFGKQGIPMASIAGPGITFLEIIASVALLIGLGTRVFAILLVCDMLGAIMFVHRFNGYIKPNGMELATLLATLALTLVLCGGGRYSVDSRMGRTTAAP